MIYAFYVKAKTYNLSKKMPKIWVETKIGEPLTRKTPLFFRLS